MKPVIALVGRPNVGKSTLFNRLTARRDALVDDTPGVTRDRLYGVGRSAGRSFIVVDTGGLEQEGSEFARAVQDQARQVVNEAGAVILLTDGRDGLVTGDRDIAAWLRRSGRAVFVAVNKSEGVEPALACAEFHALSLGAPRAISAKRGDGVEALVAAVLQTIPSEPVEEPAPETPRIAILGRPNVGKSTLVNALLGEQRLIVSDRPGTTRDSVRIPFEHRGQRYVLIDTAGVRRRSRVADTLEQLSVVKTIQAMDDANVVVLVLDSAQGVLAQDATLASWVVDSGRSMVVALNKSDAVSREKQADLSRSVAHRLAFLSYHDFVRVSALRRQGLEELLRAIDAAYASAMVSLDTGELNRRLAEATRAVAPPLHAGRPIKLKYAHQGGRNPPLVVVHGNQVAHVPEAYRRYLANFLRKAYGLIGTPLRLRFKQSTNPYRERQRSVGRKR